MIDRFDRFDFESALPVDKHDVNQRLWKPLGVIDGEYCYAVPIKPGVLIYIRSSVRSDGHAAGNGEDSIRCYIAADQTGTPLSSKPSRWITRVNGWEKRMTLQLRQLYKLGSQLKPCDKHPAMMHAFRVKQGVNKDRWFMKCPICGHWDSWLTPPVAKPQDAPPPAQPAAGQAVTSIKRRAQ